MAKDTKMARRKDFARIVEAMEQAELWTAGFPCQDISTAGKGVGITGKRSCVFFDFMRTVRLVRPSNILLENVSGLFSRGMGEVQSELAESGYDAEWDCISAADFGANHIRERIWIAAYPNSQSNISYSLRKIFSKNKMPRGNSKREWRGPMPNISRVDDGLPARTHRLKSLGNALVPQIAEWIGQRIMEVENGND